MSLQMPVTEDTPPDMLSGAMDLNVILPNGSVIKMSVERSTPMMDLLVQITTAHKLSPGSHAIHAIGDRGVLPYKPSTPIGALDTWTVNIVPKNLSKNGRYQSQSSILKCITKPFEQTFRLQVHLPRNQLYVARISPKTQLNNILKQVCFEKNLDPAKYTLRKPEKPNEPLDLNKTLVEYKLQQLSLVLNTNRTLIGGLSSDDIMSRAPKKFSCDDSLSSGSLGGRSLSPTRSDESSDPPRRPLMVKVLPSRPVRKRRLAPKPPSQPRIVPEQTIISHSRNSSDSSGYHESSVLSDAVDCGVGMTKPGKFSPSKTSGPSISRSMTNLQACGQNKNQFSEIPFTSNNIGQSKHSVSTTSLVSIQSRKKKAAPLPPALANRPKLAPPQEEPDENEPAATVTETTAAVQRKSLTLPVAAKTFVTVTAEQAQEISKTVSRVELNNNSIVVEPDLSPATSSLSSLSRSDVDRDPNQSASPCSSSIVIGCKYLSKPRAVKSKRPAPKPPVRSPTVMRPAEEPSSDQPTTTTASTALPRLQSSGSTADEEDDLRMDDDEIDRIFGDATSGYDTPSIVTVRENQRLRRACCSADEEEEEDDDDEDDDIDWEYKLPDPPSAFRDDLQNGGGRGSPTVTMFDTVTIGSNLKDAVLLQDEPAAAENKDDDAAAEDKPDGGATDGLANHQSSVMKKIIGDEYHCFPQDSGVGSDDSSLPSSCEEKIHGRDEKPAPAATTTISKTTTATAAACGGKTESPPKLNNFKIVAYDEDDGRSGGPKEIFCDESVKTWKTTQKARESNPAYRSGLSPPQQQLQHHFSAVNRHKSFSVDRKACDFSAPVKRSTSHISLLSGNIKPSNRLARHRMVGRALDSSEERLDDEDDDDRDYRDYRDYESLRLAKRSFSVDDITEDACESGSTRDDCCDRDDDDDHVTAVVLPKKTEPTLEQSSPLHSLQILKSILPQIEQIEDRHNKTKENIKDCENSSVDDVVVSGSPGALQPQTETESVADKADANHFGRSLQTYSVTDPKTIRTDEEPCPPLQTAAAAAAATTTVNDKTENAGGKRYSYAGPPKINLSTWNERPKRQVSIKTDRDYVIGFRQRLQQQQQLQHQQQQQQPKTDAVRVSSSESSVSRVPIVKSVELKKPYVEQLLHTTAAVPSLALSEAIKAQAKLSNGFRGRYRGGGGDEENARSENNKKEDGGPFGFGKPKLALARRKPREISANALHDPRESLLESIRSFGGRDNLKKIRAL